MPDGTFEILFRTKSELEGAVQQLQALERQRGAAVALGKDYSGLDGQIQTVQGSLKSFGEAGEENAKAVKEAMSAMSGDHEGNPLHMIHGHLRQIRVAMRLAGIQAGEMGHLLHFATDANVLGFVALGLAAAKLAEHIKSLKEDFEKLKAIAFDDFPAITQTFISVRDAIRSANEESSQFILHLQDAATKQDTLKESMDRSTKTLGAENKLIGDYIKGTEEALNSLIGMAVKSGQLTPQQGAQIGFLESIRSAITGHRAEVDDKFREGDVVARTRDQAKADMEEARKIVPGKEQATKLAESNVKALQDDIQSARAFLQSDQVQKLADLQSGMIKAAGGDRGLLTVPMSQIGEAIEKLRGEAAKESGTPAANVPTSATQRMGPLEQFAELRTQFEQLQNQFRTAAQRVEFGDKALPEVQAKADSAKRELEQAKDKANEAATAFKEASNKLREMAQEVGRLSEAWKLGFPSLAANQFHKSFGDEKKFPAGTEPDLITALTQGGASRQEIQATILQLNREISIMNTDLKLIQNQSAIRTGAQDATRTPGVNGN